MKVLKAAPMGQSGCGPETKKGMTLRREGSSCLHPSRTLLSTAQRRADTEGRVQRALQPGGQCSCKTTQPTACELVRLELRRSSQRVVHGLGQPTLCFLRLIPFLA